MAAYHWGLYRPAQEIVPAHLVTSPIPREDALFRSREPRSSGPAAESSQPMSPEDPASAAHQLGSNAAGKKKKRRRRKHKAEQRKEEQTPPSGAELELCELSSDEEHTAHGGWYVPLASWSLTFDTLMPFVSPGPRQSP